MKAATATGSALIGLVLPLPAVIIRTSVGDRRYIDVYRHTRTRIVGQRRDVAAALILVRDAIAGETVLIAIDGAAASHFALIVLVAIVGAPRRSPTIAPIAAPVAEAATRPPPRPTCAPSRPPVTPPMMDPASELPR